MAVELKLPAGYTYSQIITEVRNERTVYVKEITDEESAKLWLNKLSEITFETWRSLRGYVTNGTKVIFKQLFRCQHSQQIRNRPMKGKEKTIRSSKNTGCEAELLMTVRRIRRHSRINPKDLAILKDYPTVVTFKNEHNHFLTSHSFLKYRPLSDEIKDKMCRLFKLGYLPSEALRLHQMDLQIEHGENYLNVSADGHYMPSVSEIYALFAKLSKTETFTVYPRPHKRRKPKNQPMNQSNEENGPSVDTLFADLETYIDEYQKQTRGKVIFKRTTCGSHYYTVICTPLMIRAHSSIKQSGDLVMVDAWGGSDKEKHRIYLIAAPTAAGGVPLGVIITDSVDESVFLEALLSLKGVIGDWGFYARKQPQVILCDANEINALQEVFPDSKKLLCQFRLLRHAWRWICDPAHQVGEIHRQEAFVLFRKILYSKDESTAEKGLWDVILFAEEKNCGLFKQYVSKMYDKKEDWVSCYRLHESHGSHTKYVGVVVFRIIRDVIFNRTKAYNLLQLLDFSVKRYEEYMRHRLHDFRCGRYSGELLKHVVPGKFDEVIYDIRKTGNEFIFKVVNVSENQKHLIDSSEIEEVLVDLEAAVCSCSVGENGKLCGHSSSVILMLERENVNAAYNLVCENTKCFFVAEGMPPPTQSYCPPEAPGQKSVEIPSPTVAALVSTHNQQCVEKDGPSHVKMDCQLIVSEEVENDSCGADADPIIYISNGKEVPSVSAACATTFQDRKLQGLWTSFETRLAKVVEDNPATFEPALHQFFKNLESHCKTDEELATALYSFGTFWGKRRLEAR